MQQRVKEALRQRIYNFYYIHIYGKYKESIDFVDLMETLVLGIPEKVINGLLKLKDHERIDYLSENVAVEVFQEEFDKDIWISFRNKILTFLNELL